MAKINGFEGDYKGLTEEEVVMQQQKYGKNVLVPEKKRTLLMKILSIFKEPMLALLFGTALVYFLLGQYRDGIIMLFFVMFVTGINFFQEWRTDKTLEALKDLSSPKVKVIRDDDIKIIDSKEITVGDIVIISEGEKVPADLRIIEMHDLGVDESVLTGESVICWKKANLEPEEEKEYWRKDRCYAGTTVVGGMAITEAIAVGLDTEYGKIGIDVQEAPDRPTPLEKQTRHLIKVALFISIGLFLLVFLITYIHRKDIIVGLLSGISITMAMIPEEFPVVSTVFLAMGAWRLARRNSLIRHIPAIETLGAISVLCVDKTGTLTKNRMDISDLYYSKDVTEKDLIKWAILASEAESYDPMEKAIVGYGEKLGIDVDSLFSMQLVHEYPFSSEIKMKGHIWDINGNKVLAAKGSPESIIPLCHLKNDVIASIKEKQKEMASNGYRVIAVAKNEDLENIPEKLYDNGMEFIGLIGFVDPPREAVPGAIDICNKAGIRVAIITGDNGLTAKTVAKEIGILNYNDVITGPEIDEMTDEELKERVKTTSIFARVIPRHKMRIVSAFKAIGEVVAMTGDGVNDAPALKYADIGIAMGKRGTEVAKEAADMILLDDNFTTIVDTIRDGRRIYDNIKKAFEYVIVIHIPLALSAIFAPLLHLPLLLFPIHVVLLELIIDPTCSIVFERQPAETNIMKRMPRPKKEPLMGLNLMAKAIFQGVAIFAASFISYMYMLNSNMGENTARTFALTVIIFANLFLVYINQSESESIFRSFVRLRDRVIWYVNTGIAIGLLAIIYLPFINGIAKTHPLNLVQFIMALVVAAVSTIWWEVVKLLLLR